jgi:hypothetical protein
MLYRLPANITNKLQRVQNTAARLISRTKKHQHITPRNITYNSSIERKTTIRKVLYPMFGCKNNQLGLILIQFWQIISHPITDISQKRFDATWCKSTCLEVQLQDTPGSATSKLCFYQIRNIGRIRTYITDDVFKTLVNSLVTSQLKERRQSEKSFTRGLGAKTINSVLI